jgi:hypothetical protein
MQRITRARPRHTLAQKDKILAAYQRSTMSQKEFAAQARIGLSTLTLWLRQANVRKPDRAAFVAVPNLFSAPNPAPAYRLQWPQGLTVEVAAGFHHEELGALLQMIQSL